MPELELVSFGSMSVSAFYSADGAKAEVDMITRVLEHASDEDACTILKHGGWTLRAGRLHFGYLRDKATRQPCSIQDIVEEPCETPA